MNDQNRLDELVRVFADPVIVWPGSDSSFTASVCEAITIQRLARAAQGLKHPAALELATLAEAMVYLATASLSFPFDSEWTKVYLYCCTQVMGDRAPADCRQEALSAYERSEFLEPLLRWIRRKQDERWQAGRRGASRTRQPPRTPPVEQLAFRFQ
jgi:hypothetical protein